MLFPEKKYCDIGIIETGKYDVNHAAEDGDYLFFTCASEPFKANTFSFDNESIILPGNGANVGLSLYYQGKFEAYQRTYVLSKMKAFPKYVYYVFQSNWSKYVRNKQYGSATNYIRYDTIADFPIPLPSLSDQRRIAEILDHADAIRRKNGEILEKYNQLAQSVFLEMFGDPLSKSNNWKVVELSRLCNKITDGTHKTPNYVNNGIPFLSAKNVKNRNLTDSDTKFISQSEHNELSKRCKPEYGDILLTKSGSIGMAAINDLSYDFSIFESLALIKYKKELINGKFLWMVMNNPSTLVQYAEKTKGVGVKHLHLGDINQIKIILPEMTLQNKFSMIIEKIESQKLLAKQSLEKSDELFQSLLQRAFRGEL